MSYAQLIRLEDQADYFDELYLAKQTSDYMKGDTRIMRIVNPPVVGEFIAISALGAGTYASPDTAGFLNPSIASYQLTKIGLAGSSPRSFNTTPVTFNSLAVLNQVGTWFSPDAPNGVINCTGTPVDSNVRVTFNVNVLNTSVTVIGDLIFTLFHYDAFGAGLTAVAATSIPITAVVNNTNRGAMMSAQVQVKSDADYFYVAIQSDTSISVLVNSASLCIAPL